MSEEMMQLTLGIVGKTLFDADVVSEAQQVGEAMTVVMDLFTPSQFPSLSCCRNFPCHSCDVLTMPGSGSMPIIYR